MPLFRIIAEAQKLGYRPVIIDSESSYNDAYAAKCGINIEDYYLNIVNKLEASNIAYSIGSFSAPAVLTGVAGVHVHHVIRFSESLSFR